MRDSEPGKIFIGGLNYITSDESLTNYFIRYGAIKDSVVMKEKDGKPRGFGFVTYADPTAATAVLNSPPGTHVVDGKAVDVKTCVGRDSAPAPSSRGGRGGYGDSGGFGGRGRGAPRGGRGSFGGGDRGGGRGGFGGGRPAIVSNQCKIFVGGLPAAVTEHDLRNAFLVYGGVRDAVVMIDQATQRSKGFGFVTFDSDDAVERATNEQYMSIQNKKVEVKRATGGPGAGGPGAGGSDSSRGGRGGGSSRGGGRGGYGGGSSNGGGYGGGGYSSGEYEQPWGQDSQSSYGGQGGYEQQPPQWSSQQQQQQQQPWSAPAQPPPQQSGYGGQPPAADPYGSQYGTSGYGSFEAAAPQYSYPYPDAGASAAGGGGPPGYSSSGYPSNGAQPATQSPYGGVSGYPSAPSAPQGGPPASAYGSSYPPAGNGASSYGQPSYAPQAAPYAAPDVGGYGKTTLASSQGGRGGGPPIRGVGRGGGPGGDANVTRGRGGAQPYHPYRR